jgi:pyruvate,water dikinase
MPKTRAIVADLGSATGHMTSLAREFTVPAVLDAKLAKTRILPGMEISMDAYSGKVY